MSIQTNYVKYTKKMPKKNQNGFILDNPQDR